MVALLKDDGEFTPMPVVRDTQKFERLAASMEEQVKPAPGLAEMIRKSREQFNLKSK